MRASGPDGDDCRFGFEVANVCLRSTLQRWGHQPVSLINIQQQIYVIR